MKVTITGEPPEAGGEKVWAIFKISAEFNGDGFWMMANKKLTKREIFDLQEAARWNYDFAPFGLDLSGGHSLILSTVHLDAPKGVALRVTDMLNRGVNPLELFLDKNEK